jgi:hypothetical protein
MCFEKFQRRSCEEIVLVEKLKNYIIDFVMYSK